VHTPSAFTFTIFALLVRYVVHCEDAVTSRVPPPNCFDVTVSGTVCPIPVIVRRGAEMVSDSGNGIGVLVKVRSRFVIKYACCCRIRNGAL
jgi:hypothetical protein